MKILKPQKMQHLKHSVMVILCLFSLQALGQGVPKAYVEVNYQGTVNGRQVRLILANGYIGASALKVYAPGKKKPRLFAPDAGVANEHNRLKFVAANQGNSDYFILDNIQDAYKEIPASISGIYFFNSKKMFIKFRQI